MTSYSTYRRFLWYYKGKKEYTKQGFETAQANFRPTDLEVDCSGRHFIITGANAGLGLETAKEIAKRGGTIHMVCRNSAFMAEAKSQIVDETENDNIFLHELDLAKPKNVIKWAELFALNHSRLDVLIHNAGCMVHENIVDEDGIETNFAVNALAIHILTLIFMPLLQRTPKSRVVMVSSGGMLLVKLQHEDLMHSTLTPFNGRLVYSQNKRQQVVMNLQYAQRYESVKFFCMHPGWVDTKSVRNSIPEFYERHKNELRSVAEGADTIIWLAISEAAMEFPSDRAPVASQLPLAWTRSTSQDEEIFMKKLNDLFLNICTKVGYYFGQTKPTSTTTGEKETTRQLAEEQ